jgi:hypothetical protein
MTIRYVGQNVWVEILILLNNNLLFVLGFTEPGYMINANVRSVSCIFGSLQTELTVIPSSAFEDGSPHLVAHYHCILGHLQFLI